MISPTQTRKYKNTQDKLATSLLDNLIRSKNDVDTYRDSMFKVGVHLGRILRESVDRNKKYCIAITAEDADFLAKGILESLNGFVDKAYLACFWNERSNFEGNSIAPILNSYYEDGFESSDGLIVVKSIISGSCVVKTNITALFSKLDPKEIHVVAPVMHTQSEQKLEREFSKAISKRFKYTFLAQDSKRLDNGDVVPGIGGDVYKNLGFSSQANKNSYMPDLIADKLFA